MTQRKKWVPGVSLLRHEVRPANVCRGEERIVVQVTPPLAGKMFLMFKSETWGTRVQSPRALTMMNLPV